MLKKCLGVLTLLVFTFTFAVPLFIVVDTADATPTIVHTQDWQTNFYCPDGTYATSSSGTHESTYDHGHPESVCTWWWVGYWLLDCKHVGHAVTYYHNHTLDYTEVILSNNDNYCD